MLCLSLAKQKIGWPTLAIVAFFVVINCPSILVRSLQTSEAGHIEPICYRYRWAPWAESGLFCHNHLSAHDLCVETTVQLVLAAVSGRPESEVLELLGSPAINEGPIRFEGFPEEAAEADENWIYYVNGQAVVLSFAGSFCKSSQTADSDSACSYATSRAQQLEKWACGRQISEISRRVHNLRRNASFPSWAEPQTSKDTKGDSCWTGMTGLDDGIWFVAAGNRCIRTQAFHVWH